MRRNGNPSPPQHRAPTSTSDSPVAAGVIARKPRAARLLSPFVATRAWRCRCMLLNDLTAVLIGSAVGGLASVITGRQYG